MKNENEEGEEWTEQLKKWTSQLQEGFKAVNHGVYFIHVEITQNMPLLGGSKEKI
jgi:hypothetical protein